VNAIARVLAARRGSREGGDAPALRRIARRDLHDLAETLLAMRLAKRRRLAGLDPARADTLGLGAVVLDEILAAVGAREVVTCKAAVREGMVLDHLATHATSREHRGAAALRERSVRDAMERYGGAREHAQHVSTLALAIFDGTRRLHRLGAYERAMLGFGGLLHDVGSHVEHRRHHRHGHYLVRHAGLRGFEPEEVELLAVLARYHRRGGPRPDHDEWKALPRRLRDAALPMIGILRVADGLDRGHAQEVTGLRLRCARDAVVLTISGRRDLTLDADAALAKSDVFEEAFGRPLLVRT
jgi:exopolyphosphatase/guanosine-5'-triphosphate,3'-diphosphate pyrophosphatase